jgi:signal transduction histidine kinase
VPVELAVTADVNGVAHVLENLLANAAKFSPADSQIIVSAREHDGEVVVTVADDGVGIAPEEQEQIWERFYQSDSIEMSRRGTGIGLAIVKRFVEVQGGRSWVESTPGRGARFSFTLPRAAPDVERTVPA